MTAVVEHARVSSRPSIRARLLVVEDEPLILMALEDALDSLGFEVAGAACDLDEALQLASGLPLDGAILDVNIAGQEIYPVADVLARRRIPFVFVTGYGKAGLRDCDRNRPVLQKPYRLDTLAKIIERWGRP